MIVYVSLFAFRRFVHLLLSATFLRAHFARFCALYTMCLHVVHFLVASTVVRIQP